MSAILKILSTILGAAGGAEHAIAKAGKLASLAVILPAIWNWYQGHGHEIAVELTWGQLILMAGFVYAVVQVADTSARKNKNAEEGR